MNTNRLKQNTLLLILFLLCFRGFSQTKVISFNIRYDNPNDGENWWNHRKEEVATLIDFYAPDFLGVQEGLIHQLTFLDKELTNYSYVGVGRDDGKKKGEFTAIFFDRTKFKLIETKTFWLSKTPHKVSIGWDASMERIATYGVFVNKKTKEIIHIFNCHFDHIGKISREMSAQLILKKIKEFGLDKSSVIVMGDFNCEPQDKPIQVFKTVLDDAAKISKKPLYGPRGTFNSFNNSLATKQRIDYIFTKNITVKSYRHIDDRRKNNLCISDHLPVLVEFEN